LHVVDVVVDGVLGGGVLGLAALGVSLTWWVDGQFNLAQGAIVLVGAYVGWAAAGLVTPLGALVAAALAGASGGGLVSVIIGGRLRRHPAPLGLLVSFGAGLAIVGGLQVIATDDYRSIALGLHPALSVIGVGLPPGDVAAALAALGGGALLAWIRDRRPAGLVLRAVAEDPEAARMSGVRVAFVSGVVGACSGAAAGVAGWALGSAGAFSTSDADRLVLLVSVVAVLGGPGRIVRTLLAGFGLGGLSAIIGAVVAPRLIELAALLVLFAALAGLPPRREAATSRGRGRPEP
jgi:branched-subunit amino acid ABC-type transport system permease component